MRDLRHRVRYTPLLRDTALRLVKKRFGLPGKFNAVHVRLGDYTPRTPAAATYEKRCRGAGLSPDLPLYVSTEPNPPKGFFNALCKPTGTYKCVFSKDLDKDTVNAFRSAFPPGQIRNDMLGIVEQLLCVAARGFVGTSFSTFSYAIAYMRKNRGSSFPELLKYKPRNGPWTTPENEAEDDGAGPGGVGGSRGDDVDEDDDTDDGRFSAAGDAPDLEDDDVVGADGKVA